MAQLRLNERQRMAIRHVKISGQITNLDFQRLANIPRRTSVRDLMDLVTLGVLDSAGTGRGARYVLSRKRAKNVPNVPLAKAVQPPAKRAKNVPNVPRPGRATKGTKGS
jgi:hypothetical protein